MADDSGKPWSEAEISATARSYFAMLKLKLAGRSYHKSEQNALLRVSLDRSSKGAAEFKHQNISAVLMERGWVPMGLLHD